MGETDVERTGKGISTSLVKILKTLFKKQEAKKERHAHQSSTALGIDYSEDLVVMLVGVD